ncbi:MAG: DUF2291 family protein [Janthinobacterium lividum]
MTIRATLLLGSLCLLSTLPGCRFVKTGSVTAGQASGTQDPKARVDALWTPQLLAYAKAKAAPYPELAAQLAKSPDDAIKAHGHRGSDAAAKPVLFTQIDGTVVDVETASRAGTLSVDVDGDGKPDVTVQIGPVIRGSALRDGLDFISFSSFSNQIDFADFSKALNAHVRDVVLKDLPRDQLKGRRISILGAFFADPANPVPLVTPITITLPEKTP